MPNLDQRRRRTHGLSRRSFVGIAGGTAAAALLDPAALVAGPCLSHASHGSSHALAPAGRIAHAAGTGGATSIEQYLGATKTVLEELTAHRNDNYYLGTPYGNTGPGSFSSDLSSWDCWHPNGKPKKNGEAYMNCTGFAVAVLEACGADCSKIGSYVAASGYDRGNKANLSRWKNWLDDHAHLRTVYATKAALLKSGKLRKGDIIIAEPNDWSASGADNHILFFWGDSPSEDLAWHSASHGDGIVAGKAPGNMISKISAKFSDCYWLHVPLENLVEIIMTKQSSDKAFANTQANDAYSLSGAKFSVFRSFKDGTFSDLITTFTTNKDGEAAVSLPPGSTAWIREDTPPLGFAQWESPLKVTIGEGTKTVALKDKPCKVKLLIEKEDEETGAFPQGHATLEGALFELVDANGNSHNARAAWDDSSKSWTASFGGLPRGKTRIREAQPPAGYLMGILENAGEDGWTTIDLSPDSHDATTLAATLHCKDRVMKGSLEGVKFREANHDEESKTPLEGCEFQLWLQDDGSLEGKGYEVGPIVDASGKTVANKAGAKLRGSLFGTMVSDENGRFGTWNLKRASEPRGSAGISKQKESGFILPFGTYTLIETACPDPSVKLLEPICDLEVKSDEVYIHLILEDRLIASPVRVVKTDAESGKPLLKEGTEIELLRKQPGGTYETVEFATHYPEEGVLKTFTVAASGHVQFPELLPWGTYAIREVKPVPPYLLSTEPVEFRVEEGRDWNAGSPIEVTLPNQAATGCIRCRKTDALTKEAVPGATYEIRALEDITGADGRRHHAQGDLVATAVTDEDGCWRVESLSLGDGRARYAVTETESPEGYVLDPTQHEVTLSYQDEKTATVSYQLDIEERPTQMTLKKQDATTGKPLEGVTFAFCPNEEKKPEVKTAQTDKDGKALITRLKGNTTYLFYEQESVPEKGYVRSDERQIRYLDPSGRWHESREAYESLKEEERMEADQECTLLFKNDFTKVAIYKVDEELWKSASSQKSDKAAKRMQQEALLEGGAFRLVDEDGKATEVRVDGELCSSWSASEKGPRILTHLMPGKRYSVIEVEAPKGYMRKNLRTEFVVGNTTEIQVVVIGNRRTDAFPATSDMPRWIIPTTAAALTAAAGTAFAAYSKRRTELERERKTKRRDLGNTEG